MDAIQSLEIFEDGFQIMLSERPDLRSQFEHAIGISAAAALSARAFGSATQEDMTRLVRQGFTTPRGGTVCRAFWWGFHIQISPQDLSHFLHGSSAVNELVGAIGGGIPSPAAPWIALAAVFVAASLQLLRSVDRGRGIYVSMSWFAPGIFVPTSV